MIDAVRTVHLALTLQGYMVDLAEASRRHPALLLGPVAAGDTAAVASHARPAQPARAASTPRPTMSRPSPSRCCRTA